MNPFRIIPDELIDWIEKRKNPERYAWLVLTLTREANWATGTYKDGVQIHRGQVRITLRKLAKKLKCSLDSIHRLISALQQAGWIKVSNQNNVTVISLLWLTQPEHLLSLNPNTSSEKPERQPEQGKGSDARDSLAQPERQPEHESQETRTPFSAQPEIRSIRSNIEVKENEIKEVRNKESSNKAAPQSSDSGSEEEGKKIDRVVVERVVEEVVREFKLHHKRKFNRYPIIDRKSKQRIVDTLIESAETEEELQELVRELIEQIPRFFYLNDPWVRKQNYSFFAFSFRISDLLNSTLKESIIPNTEEYNSSWVRI